MSELLWLAVPGGLLPDNKALVRVMVVPHLGVGRLADYGLDDWPQTLLDTEFEVAIRSGEESWRTPRATYRPLARSEVWHAFFDGDAGDIEEWRQQTQQSAEVQETFPLAGQVAGTYRRATVDVVRPGADPDAVVRREISRWDVPIRRPAGPLVDQLPPLPPRVDFHRAVGMLREHPVVLRELGLIFELEVEVADLNVGDPGERWLRVGPQGPLVRSPWTKYELTAEGFWPAPPTGGRIRVGQGMLDLEGAVEVRPAPTAPFADREPTPPWAITTVDVDGAASALHDAARALRADNDDRPVAIPAVRSAGILLIRPDRQGDYNDRAATAALRAKDAPHEAELTAEDLILGYRVDIREGDGPWRSLCERDVEYCVLDPVAKKMLHLGGNGRFREEGHVKPYPALKAADGSLRADEVIVRWDGWSLALPRVDLLGHTEGSTRNRQVDLPYEFRWDFRVPRGRLPILRFGGSYQMRVRLVDITGGGPPLKEHDKSGVGASGSVIYTRHDPVQPPDLRGDGPFPPGAAVDRLVIRSDHDMSVAELHAAEPGYPAMEQRTVHQPTVSFAIAEQHGAFDALSDERSWKLARLALLADVDEEVLPDPAARGVNAHMPAGRGGPRSERASWPDWPDTASKRIVLTEAPASGAAVSLRPWVDNGTRLEMGLAKGREVTIELSSTIRDRPIPYLGHFPASGWLSEAGVSNVGSLNGRNPLLSPVRRVHLVHAVRKPLKLPRWALPEAAVTRDEGDTTALLRPAFDADGLDINSTGRLQVSARWQEWSDSGTKPVVVDHVHSESVDRDDPPEPQIRHEFGDTKHRNVTYILKAISRFRHYFYEHEPDEAFHVSRDQNVVNIVSTARPPALSVLSTTPAFHWQTQTTATRIERIRSPRLRIQVARPWYQTGEGERLAVIVAAGDPPADVPVTEMGRDPIVASRAVPRYPPVAWFAGFAGQVVRATPPDANRQVWVVPYPVTEADEQWHADVEISPPAQAISYGPFVRLAVARYQPDSVQNPHLPNEKLSLSAVVQSDDIVRLLPQRSLVVERTAHGLGISLTGIGPNPPNRVEAVLEECDAPARVAPNSVDLVRTAEQSAEGVPAWHAIPGHTVIGDLAATLPVPLPSGVRALRLRVREMERLDTVADPALPSELRERSVFVDVIAIPTAWHRP